MVNLGAVFWKQGKEDQAEQWYRKAADAGSTDAMSTLGALLWKQGKEDQAEQWYRKAADAGRRDG
jgi:TPR repeat protein